MNFARRYRLILFVFSGIGFVDSIYLTIEKLLKSQQMCIPGLGNCFTVNNSIYSEVFGIPIAILGAAAYLSILILLWLEGRNSFWQQNAVLFIFGITLMGVLYSAYLTFIELFILNAICPFCVISALSMLTLFIFSVARLVNIQAEFSH